MPSVNTQSPARDLKITDVEAIYLRQPEVKEQCDSGQDALIVRVSTDAGITGFGEVDSARWPPRAHRRTLLPHHHLGPARSAARRRSLRNRIPLAQDVPQEYLLRPPRIAFHAMSGIDMALWDIKGKALGQPVWSLLGGDSRSPLAYASSLFGATPEETGDLARRYRDRGFTAVKFGWDPMGQDEKTDIELVREARAGLGDEAI